MVINGDLMVIEWNRVPVQLFHITTATLVATGDTAALALKPWLCGTSSVGQRLCGNVGTYHEPINGLVLLGKSSPETRVIFHDFPIFHMGLSCKITLKPIPPWWIKSPSSSIVCWLNFGSITVFSGERTSHFDWLISQKISDSITI